MDRDLLREFLALAIPLPDDTTAGYCTLVHKSHLLSHDNKRLWVHRFFHTTERAAVVTQQGNKEQEDIFVCMARLNEFKLNNKGKQTKVDRTVANAMAWKSIILDVDFKSYASEKAAITSLVTSIEKVQLPKPSALVRTGGGIHVYWSTPEAMDRDTWEPLAFALADAMSEAGLIADYQCSRDPVRILRVPYTFNYKYTPPMQVVPVKVGDAVPLKKLQTVLAPWIGRTARPHQPTTNTLTFEEPVTFKPSAPVEDELGADITNEYENVSQAAITTECPLFVDMLATGGARIAQPVWNLTGLACTFIEDGQQLFHKLSEKHAGYTVEDTDVMFFRKSMEKQRGLKWPSCASFEQAGSAECGACKHKAAGKTPLHLTLAPPPIVTPQVTARNLSPRIQTITGMPSGYSQDGNMRVYREILQEDGNKTQVMICDRPFYDGWLQRDPNALNFTALTDRGRMEDMTLAFEETSVSDAFKKAFNRQGIVEPPFVFKELQEFFVAWIKKLQEHTTAAQSLPYGWSTKDGERTGFVFNGREFTKDGMFLAATPDPSMGLIYRAVGQRAPWDAACKMILESGRMEGCVILASAFAAPLVTFTGHSGLMVHIWSSDSGIGKTTAQKVAQAVWGHPSRGVFGMTDTQNMLFRRIGQLQALPAYWDEFKDKKQMEQFVNLVFGMTRGVEKGRLLSSTKFNTSGDWKTLFLSCSNDSVLDILMRQSRHSPAGLVRVFEFEAKPPAKESKLSASDVTRMVSALELNYGMIGLEYSKFLGENIAAIDKEMATFTQALEDEVKSAKDERLWVGTMATLLLGTKYAKQNGYANFNIPELKRFLLEKFSEIRKTRKAAPIDLHNPQDVVNILAQFLGDKRAVNTIITERVTTGRGRPKVGGNKVISDMSRVQAIEVWWGKEDGVLRISSAALSDWLSRKDMSIHIFNSSMRKTLGAKMVNGSLAGGTPYSTPTQYMVEIDSHEQSIRSYFESDT